MGLKGVGFRVQSGETGHGDKGLMIGKGAGRKSRKTVERSSLKAAALGASKKKRGKCKHDRERRLCKECGGWALCEHNRRKSHCKDCRGSAICQHDRQKTQCKDCGGSAICKHKLRKIRCKDCKAEAQAAVASPPLPPNMSLPPQNL